MHLVHTTAIPAVLLIILSLYSHCIFAGPNPDHRRILLRNYDRGALPSDGTTAVEVQIPSLTVTSVSIDDKDQTLSVQGWLHTTWTDTRLSWGSESKGENDGYLHFDHNEVWKPDFALYNGAQASKSLEFFGGSQVLSGYNGSIIWVPPIKAKTFCQLNLRKWPYDTQECAIVIGSWTHSEAEVNLTLGAMSDSAAGSEKEDEGIVKYDKYLDNAEWEIVSVEAQRQSLEYDCCPGSKYPSIRYEFTLKRRACCYSYSVMLPILVITVVNILIFLLPKNKSEKLTLGIFNFLVVNLFLLHLSNVLPVLDSTPLIVVLYGANLFFIALVLVVSVVVIRFTDGTPTCGTPKWTHWLYNRSLASLLCLSSLQKITNAKRDGRSYTFKSGTAGNGSVAIEDPMLEQQPQPKPPKETEGSNRAEWLYLAAVVDRVALIIYVTLSVLLFIYVHI